MQLIVFHLCIMLQKKTKIINKENDQYTEFQRL